MEVKKIDLLNEKEHTLIVYEESNASRHLMEWIQNEVLEGSFTGAYGFSVDDLDDMDEFRFHLNINPNSYYFVDSNVIETIILDQRMLGAFQEFLELCLETNNKVYIFWNSKYRRKNTEVDCNLLFDRVERRLFVIDDPDGRLERKNTLKERVFLKNYQSTSLLLYVL
ncbi:hypothetical protein J7547_08025 [Wohlfahrtiimonas chitiniclastica]|uniref:Uncharacterized protein n=1 Tax=Wohlfahrtiimonas chitiniclastica TaxID=400946 RepID=A0AB35BYV8_9GAMM|nr:hypothetical protein [Wohlfahrtiimonas chitiniclastica]MBS7824450.1 hypothetical protein [Wohlfahrtiimonas chitiniclastica]MBS7840767.1 hypothetical protein [Wohlfahrtiimonas chitiniclastica]